MDIAVAGEDAPFRWDHVRVKLKKEIVTLGMPSVSPIERVGTYSMCIEFLVLTATPRNRKRRKKGAERDLQSVMETADFSPKELNGEDTVFGSGSMSESGRKALYVHVMKAYGTEYQIQENFRGLNLLASGYRVDSTSSRIVLTATLGNEDVGEQKHTCNEEVMFVAAEPFEEPLVTGPETFELLGRCVIRLDQVERRSHGSSSSNISMRICLEGGYNNVQHESSNDTDKQETTKAQDRFAEIEDPKGYGFGAYENQMHTA
ncbi:unnamed protein product [Arabis nemorensis]|uniref:Uncharacterized protein n=1 Tax=Arabis nemorensis TaxID=586526 RepID=A0A565BMZ4_9BRAS|nr:unnamed protein product [Arabis nemorensis]